jgi:hypothetical protein
MLKGRVAKVQIIYAGPTCLLFLTWDIALDTFANHLLWALAVLGLSNGMVSTMLLNTASGTTTPPVKPSWF